MIKHLTKHGNSLALVIDRGVLDLLDITPKTQLSITTDGDYLIVKPVRDKARAAKFREAASWTHHRYDKVFKRLAE